jgi:hypothetical protein
VIWSHVQLVARRRKESALKKLNLPHEDTQSSRLEQGLRAMFHRLLFWFVESAAVVEQVVECLVDLSFN